MKPKTKFIVDRNNSLIEVIELNDEYLIVNPQFIKKANFIIYENLDDAMYAKLIQRLENGIPLENYRTSPYFKIYVERLKIEHPEYVL